MIINQGLPAVTSALFAACYDKVPASTDLVVLDFAVNDAHVPPGDRDKNGYSFGSSDRLAFEQLVRGPGVARRSWRLVGRGCQRSSSSSR